MVNGPPLRRHARLAAEVVRNSSGSAAQSASASGIAEMWAGTVTEWVHWLPVELLLSSLSCFVCTSHPEGAAAGAEVAGAELGELPIQGKLCQVGACKIKLGC